MAQFVSTRWAVRQPSAQCDLCVAATEPYLRRDTL